MRSSSLSVFVALAALSSVESRIEQHVIAPDTPQQAPEVHVVQGAFAAGFGAAAVPQLQQETKEAGNERWFPFGGGASMYDDSGDNKAVENQAKKPEAPISRPTAFLQQPAQEVQGAFAAGFGDVRIPQDQLVKSKSSGSETWFPFSAASASVTGDEEGLPEQGFHGEDVEHKDGETSTGDWGGEYGHAPEQSSKQEKEVTTQPPTALLQEPSQEVQGAFAAGFGAAAPQLQQETKEPGNERWFPFAAASSSMFTDDKQ